MGNIHKHRKNCSQGRSVDLPSSVPQARQLRACSLAGRAGNAQTCPRMPASRKMPTIGEPTRIRKSVVRTPEGKRNTATARWHRSHKSPHFTCDVRKPVTLQILGCPPAWSRSCLHIGKSSKFACTKPSHGSHPCRYFVEGTPWRRTQCE